jgi:hypothetical protein
VDAYDLEDFDDTELAGSGPTLGSPMLDSISTSPLLHKVAAAIAAACVIGGGATVLNSQSRIAVLEYGNTQQDVQLNRIETKIDNLIERLK